MLTSDSNTFFSRVCHRTSTYSLLFITALVIAACGGGGGGSGGGSTGSSTGSFTKTVDYSAAGQGDWTGLFQLRGQDHATRDWCWLPHWAVPVILIV